MVCIPAYSQTVLYPKYTFRHANEDDHIVTHVRTPTHALSHSRSHPLSLSLVTAYVSAVMQKANPLPDPPTSPSTTDSLCPLLPIRTCSSKSSSKTIQPVAVVHSTNRHARRSRMLFIFQCVCVRTWGVCKCFASALFIQLKYAPECEPRTQSIYVYAHRVELKWKS